jgi:hypothetical protein
MDKYYKKEYERLTRANVANRVDFAKKVYILNLNNLNL